MMLLKNSIVLLTLSLQVSVAVAQHKIQLKVGELPSYHSAGDDIYLAGSFNGWNPGDAKYRFTRDEQNNYLLNINLPAGTYEFKLTRGAWDKGESALNGKPVSNRSLHVSSDTLIVLDVTGWADHFPSTPPKSTASRQVRVMDTAFYMPQLNRYRRIWVYLPACYDSCKKRYPVLYMHDGQNLFDDLTSYSGEWGVDEYLDTLGPHVNHCIVVAIDHGGSLRLNEYSPHDFELTGLGAMSSSGKGEGAAYADFLVKTLKPYIDTHYRTAKGKNNTAIAGSSMGGMISLYAVLRYPKVFGAAGVFSPAFWIAPAIYDDIEKMGKKVKSKIYFYAGKKESETMVPGTLKAHELMSRYSRSELQSVIRDEGTHNESTWRKEFPLFYQWINQ